MSSAYNEHVLVYSLLLHPSVHELRRMPGPLNGQQPRPGLMPIT